MSSAVRVLRRKRRQSNLGTGAAVIAITSTVSFPPQKVGNQIRFVLTLNAADAVSSLPFTAPELARIKCAQHEPVNGWTVVGCTSVTDLGDDPAGRSYELAFTSGNFVDPLQSDTQTFLGVPPDSQLFTSASGAAARAFFNGCPALGAAEPYLVAAFTDIM